MNSERQDVYTRITDKIIADLEQGVRTWMKPWNAGNTAGRITRPLRHNGVPYSGINILMLWAEAMDKGFAAPIWMTFRQATELERPCPQGRERLARRLCQLHHPHRRRRQRRGDRARDSLHEGLHRLQRRAD